MAVVVARVSFHGPDHLVVHEGQLFDAAHPTVVAHPDMFRPAHEVAVTARTAPWTSTSTPVQDR